MEPAESELPLTWSSHLPADAPNEVDNEQRLACARPDLCDARAAAIAHLRDEHAPEGAAVDAAVLEAAEDCPRCAARLHRPNDPGSAVDRATVGPISQLVFDPVGAPAPDAAARNLPHRIGDYDVLGFLDEGAMGRVYRARDRRLDRDVALKILLGPTGVTTDADAADAAVQAMLCEARAAARIDHPNIVPIHAAGRDEESGVCFIASELVRGESLRKYLQRRGPMPPREALALAAQILSALAALHPEGVAHRDLKPDNLLVDVVDGRPRVRLADFGIARTGPGASRQRSGTPGYMAPEQRRGEDGLDPRVDLHATGVILREMLTGQQPDAPTSDPWANTPAAQVPPQLRLPRSAAVPTAARAALKRLVARATEPGRSARFQSADSFLQAIREVESMLPHADRSSVKLWSGAIGHAGVSLDAALHAQQRFLAHLDAAVRSDTRWLARADQMPFLASRVADSWVDDDGAVRHRATALRSRRTWDVFDNAGAPRVRICGIVAADIDGFMMSRSQGRPCGVADAEAAAARCFADPAPVGTTLLVVVASVGGWEHVEGLVDGTTSIVLADLDARNASDVEQSVLARVRPQDYRRLTEWVRGQLDRRPALSARDLAEHPDATWPESAMRHLERQPGLVCEDVSGVGRVVRRSSAEAREEF